jgi:hypothetical protein
MAIPRHSPFRVPRSPLTLALLLAACALFVPRAARAQGLRPRINETIHGGLTVDGWGEISSPTTFASGEFHLQIPRGARVRAAVLFSGTLSGNASPVIPAGPAGNPRVVIVGTGPTAITRTLEGMPNYVNGGWGTFATDVTDAVRGVVGATAPGGPIAIPVRERGDGGPRYNYPQLMGHSLAVEYELDSAPLRNVVVYEGCVTTGYIASLPLPGPVANRCPVTSPRSEPFAASFSVFWEYNVCEEDQTFRVNGVVLTTRGGGSDDWPSVPPGTGCGGNTAGLVTVGSFGGAEPTALTSVGAPVGLEGDVVTGAPVPPRLDDELYDFRTVVADGATALNVVYTGSDGDQMIGSLALQTIARVGDGAGDADSDGFSDPVEGDCTVDTDGDGTPDYLDRDSDNDCTPDAMETATGRTDPALPGGTPCSNPLPVCDRTRGECVACTLDTQCPATAPACATMGPRAGQCVACTTDARCSGATPRCDPATNTCVACLAHADCPTTAPECSPTHVCGPCTADAACAGRAGTPACNTSTGLCAQCTATNASACGGATPVCNAATNRCVQCTSDAQCSDPTPLCHLASNTCVACLTDAQCGGLTPVCDPLAHACRGCTADVECGGATPACAPSGACVQCTPSMRTACTGATPVCGPANTCVLCTAGPGGDATACASSPDGRACVVDAATMAAFCGCDTDADCGGMMSGRICDPLTRRCREGCSPAPGRNTCPAGQFCTSDAPARTGVCTTTCNFDADCRATMPTRPVCLRNTPDAGAASMCVECATDAHCEHRLDGRVRCVGAEHTCAQCSPEDRALCTPSGVGSACLPTGLCGCTGDTDCAPDRRCDVAAQRCEPRPVEPDAGPDAEVDAGTDAGPDAGTDARADAAMDAADAGGHGLTGGGACACRAAGWTSGRAPHGLALVVLAVLGALARRRRR